MCALIRPFLLAISLSGQALAEPQPARELNNIPPDIQAMIDSQPHADLTRIWAGDFTGDRRADALVQTAYAYPGGGNAVALVWRLFEGTGTGHRYLRDLDLPAGIDSASFDTGLIDVLLNVYQDGDPRCCPSGLLALRVRP